MQRQCDELVWRHHDCWCFKVHLSAIGVVAVGAVAGLVVGLVFPAPLLPLIPNHNRAVSAMHEDLPLARLVPRVDCGLSFVGVVVAASAATRLPPVNTLFFGGAWYCRLGSQQSA